MSTTGFEALSQNYDALFSHSPIGRLQRTMVWNYLNGLDLRYKSVLDIGCGTGEDVSYFQSKHCHIQAFDPALAMVEKTKSKLSPDTHNASGVKIWQDSVGSWLQKQPDLQPYDLIFSNFGALNLISPVDLRQFARYLSINLRQGADVILVLMPPTCVWETVYFLAKGSVRKAFRRRRSPLPVKIGGARLNTWYHHPKYVRTLFCDLQIINIRPVGIAIPPSYLDSLFINRNKWLKQLARWEHFIAKKSLFAAISDHFLIHLRKNHPSE